MRDIKLYIDNKRVDLDASSIITLTYTLDDTRNPTVVKNTFSKSITLPATANNDAIFATMRDTTTRIEPGTGFSPLVRMPFKLYGDSELIESGYMQLNEVGIKGGRATYKITLFGGVGNFLYALMYDDEGNKRTLADLDFGDDEQYMRFGINKDRVVTAWADTNRDDVPAITFVPAYNGIPGEFDAEHAIVKLSSNIGGSLPQSLTDGNKTFKPYNNCAVVEFPKAVNEWEVRDLRSYMQRPALSVRRLFEAMARPENNGGTEVVLDPAFFNDDNPQYNDAYITLPMLNNGEKDAEEMSITFPELSINSADPTESRASKILAGTLPASTIIKVNVPISLYIAPEVQDVPELYDSVRVVSGEYVAAPITVGVIVRNSKGGSEIARAEYTLGFTGDIVGAYKKKGNRYIFTDASGGNTFPMEVSFIKGSTVAIDVAIRVERTLSVVGDLLPTPLTYYPRDTVNSVSDVIAWRNKYTSNNNILTNNSTITAEQTTAGIGTGSSITKKMLLSTNATPADYLLSYTKLFGLRFLRDRDSKKITITPNYFTGEVMDISDRIDYGGDIKITPTTFDKRIMRCALDTPESYFARKYKDAHGIEYAQKRIDTGYGFNSETEEIYDGNVYTTAIPCRAVSKLFYAYKESSTKEVPPPFALGIKYGLAVDNGGVKIDVYSKDIPSTQLTAASSIMAYNTANGYDAMPKMCYFDMNGDTQEPIDIANNLVIYCGDYACKDANGNAIAYYVSDDTEEMVKLNGKVCYYISYDANDANVTHKDTLPLFLSIRLLSNGNVRDGFDFAKSKEHYLGQNIDYPESATLYTRYWQEYYEDRMDVNTRIVECMVNFDGIQVDIDTNRRFYYFDNAYWLLNKIVDYNPATTKLTKCQFIKVRNMSTYYKTKIEE